MSLLVHEDTYHPLMLVIAKGKPSIEQHIASLKSWDTWFNSNEAFHVIRFFEDGDSLDIPAGAGRMTQDWLTEGADVKFRLLVKSMCIVVPQNKYEKMKKMSVNKVFGIPGEIFSSIDDIFEWYEKNITPLNMLGIGSINIKEIKNAISVHQSSQ